MLDPLMRLIGSRMPREPSLLTGFADDLAALFTDFFEQFPKVMQVFEEFEKVSGLSLNVKKCVLVPLWSITVPTMKGWLETNVPLAQACAICQYAKYLGIMLGPEAAELSWKASGDKLVERARQVRSMKQGLCKAIVN